MTVKLYKYQKISRPLPTAVRATCSIDITEQFLKF